MKRYTASHQIEYMGRVRSHQPSPAEDRLRGLEASSLVRRVSLGGKEYWESYCGCLFSCRADAEAKTTEYGVHPDAAAQIHAFGY